MPNLMNNYKEKGVKLDNMPILCEILLNILIKCHFS